MISRREFVGGAIAFGLTPRATALAPRVRIGLLAPLSGEFSPLGQAIREAAELGAEEGGVILEIMDTEANPLKAAECVKKLAGLSVVACLGPIGVSESMAAAAHARRLGLPMVSLCPDPRVEESFGPKAVWRWRTSPEEDAAELVSKLDVELRGKRAAILAPKSDYGRSAARGFLRAWPDGNVTRYATYPLEKPNFRRALEELVGARRWVGRERKDLRPDRDGYVTTGLRRQIDFDVLFIPDHHVNVSRILGFLPLVGIQNGDGGKGAAVQLLGLGGWRGETMALTGAKAAGAIILDSYGGSSQGGRAEELERLFDARYGRFPTSLEAEVFDAVWWLSKVGRSGRAKFALEASALGEITGASGATRFVEGRIERESALFRMDIEGQVSPL